MEDILKQKRMEHAALVERLVKPGDILTHTRCMGIIEEHEFVGMDGRWMVGTPTRDTFRFGGADGIKMTGQRTAKHNQVNDIYAGNVTHINRVPVECVEMLANEVRPA